MPWAMEVLLVLAERKRDEENQEASEVDAGLPKKGYSGIDIFTVSQLSQSGIGIPASGSVRYRWLRNSPVMVFHLVALPSFSITQNFGQFQKRNFCCFFFIKNSVFSVESFSK
jgi:hypothetical protein